MIPSHAKTTFRLAVFDVAGTTVMDDDGVVECLRRALEPHVAVSAAAAAAVMGLPKPVAIRELLAAHVAAGAPLDGLVDEIHLRFRLDMVAHYRSGSLAPAERAEDVFAALRAAGVRVTLDTGFSRDILDVVLERLGWVQGGLLDATMTSDEVPRGRPFPDLIHRAMALTGVTDPAQVAKIGDTPSDMAEGLAAGCGLVVGVSYGTHTREQLSQPGVVVIDRLSDLLPLMGAPTL
jgi:phosphonatase-like hydrolase